MRKILTTAAVCVLTCSVLVFADEATVDFDQHVDFSAFKTFALRPGTVASPRPELDNPLFVKELGAAIRAGLVARRLTEAANQPDLLVDYRITNEDVSTTRRGGGYGPQPVRFTEGLLVIDILRPGESTPIWRGVYRDDERTGAKLLRKLPADARKLLDRFPPPKPKH